MNFNDIAKQIKETDYNQITAAFKGADFKSVMEHVKAVITTKYYCFDGRTASGDFWRYILPVIVLCCIPLIGQLIALATILPTTGITCRRLHDVGKSGWWIFTILIPCVGWIFYLTAVCAPSQLNDNQYGPNPNGSNPDEAWPVVVGVALAVIFAILNYLGGM